MPFDGIALRAVAAELREKLTGGRVEKVSQPERDELHLIIRNQYQNYRLLLSATANFPRAHLSRINKPNPDKAPMFCMLLRKHLIGGKVLSVSQPGMERVLDITFGVLDELGRPGELTLHAEIMGRHSNLVLTDERNVILDSIKRVTEEKSRVREVLPGLAYVSPPSQGKRDLLVMEREELATILAVEKPMFQALCDGLAGLAQPTAREMLRLCGCDPAVAFGELSEQARQAALDGLWQQVQRVRANDFHPVVLLMGGEASDFLPFADSAGAGVPNDSMSEAVEAFYAARDSRERLRQNSANMVAVLTTALNRARKKLEKQAEGFTQSEGLETYRLKGELLMASLHLSARGAAAVEVPNYYDENGGTLTVELDPALSAADNAQRYYKRYNKAKSALDNLKVQMEATREEIAYLESQLTNIELSAAEAELDEIRAELVREGFLRDAAARSRKKSAPGQPHHYVSGDGHDIYVGRNNTQNDALTMKFARNDDIWLHTKEIPGSHVIIRAVGGAVSDAALNDGALLAAWYSKARASSGVPVDYTQRRNVKKPNGSRPGFVIYLTNRTIVVTPDEERVKALKQIAEKK